MRMTWAALDRPLTSSTERERQMALRDKLIVLADDLWVEACDATARRSRIEAFAKRDAANRIRAAMDMEPLVGGDGNGDGADQ